ncbi:MAG: hypothetical protein LBK29_01940 [Oscillospiraceae bacterium]|jgi:hypothetical protein|nr:hypothetical protein [Oscillospiraceae bacterium]
MTLKSSRNFILILVLSFFFVFFAKKIFEYVFLSVRTEEAKFVSLDEFIDAEAIVFREETVLTSEFGFVQTTVKEGCRAAQGEVIALGFDVVPEYNYEYNFEIDEFENLWNIKNLIRKISEEIRKIKLNQNLNQKNLNKISSLIYQKEKKLGNFTNLANKNKDKSKILNCEKIKTSHAGYFSCFTDGMESFACDENVFDLDLNKITSSPKAFGKLVTSSDCRILCKLSNEKDFDKICENNPILIKFNLDSKLINCEILSTNDKIITLSACLNDNLLKLRHEKIKIRVKHVEGFKIKKTAIKKNEEVAGVFIKHHKSLNFKKVDILYEKDGFAVCSDSSEIVSGDEIVISGLNLYDGKRVI